MGRHDDEKSKNSTREHIIPIKIEKNDINDPYYRSSTPRPPSPASTMIEIDSDLDETIRPSSRSNESHEIIHKIDYSTSSKTTKESEGDKKKVIKEEEKRLKKIKDDEKKLRKEQEKKQKDYEKEAEKNRKQTKKLQDKMNISKKSAKIDINDNPMDDSKKKDKKSDKKIVKNPPPITVQPGKSILKNPLATSTPIPPPDSDDSDNENNYTNLKPSSNANEATFNRSGNSTIIHKKPSKCSKCKSWFCLPFGLCCICNPFECECFDCCYLRCVRCDQCICRCCNQKCC